MGLFVYARHTANCAKSADRFWRPIQVLVEVLGTAATCKGDTIVVNLRGALIKMSAQLELGSQIRIHVADYERLGDDDVFESTA